MMQTTAPTAFTSRPNTPDWMPTATIIASIVFHMLIIGVCINLSNSIATLDNRTQFGNLGQPVQDFARVFVLLPALLAGVSSLLLVARRPLGRFLTLMLQFSAATICAMSLIHTWGVFSGFERLVDAIMANAWITLGFALAYAVFWLSGKLDDGNKLKSTLTNAAMILGMGSLVLLIWLADVLNGVNYVLSTYANANVWFLTLGLAAFAGLWFSMLRIGSLFGETPAQLEAWQGWLMLSPNIIGFLLFFAGPLLLSFYLSFTNSSVGRTPEIIGTQNYAQILSLEIVTRETTEVTRQSLLSRGYTPLFHIDMGSDTQMREIIVGARDALFWRSMFNTFLFCLMLIPLSTIPAIILAMILNSKLPGVKFFRAIYFLPSVAAVVGTALIWRWLYNPTVGFFNYFITQGVNFFNDTFNMQMTDPQIQWLTSPSVVLISVVLLSAWQVVGFNTVLFLAGLQGIPKDLYEAATVDGANRRQQFRFVTLPMLAPTTFFVLVTTLITGLQVFNEPYALFPSIPIPIEATTAVYNLYDVGFKQAQFGYSSALAWLLFIVIFAITLIQFRFTRTNAYE